MIEIDKFINCIIALGKIKNFIIHNNTLQIENLRKFHNFIKLNLIIDVCKRTNAKNLLDIACGRGGDLQKWINNKNNLQYILAFDSHQESIFSSIKKGNTFDGAIARFQNIKQNFRGKMPYIMFKNLSILDNNILEKLNSFDSNKKYDVVSCQFALHYFCKNDNILNNVLSVISVKLRKGGLFIGTATDGDLINKILNNGNVNIPLLTLLKKDFNNYLFYIQTEKSKVLTRQNYFELQGVSSEFYLFKEKLKNLALKNNLKLIEYKSFYEWYQIYKKNKAYNKLTIYEMVISFLNFSFIFIKI
uniref:mRNA (guanine-N(7))-methyltransferase n=1 Tax=viral metagenome TaxID=1070528 RepID=A0A6C0LGZ3_9ZZZZ